MWSHCRDYANDVFFFRGDDEKKKVLIVNDMVSMVGIVGIIGIVV